MSIVAAFANGNLTAAGTWELVDTASYLNSETAAHVVTTAYGGTTTANFTPGAITIDGLGVKLAVRTGTTGTITVHLEIATVEVTGTAVTINCSDLPAAVTADANGGWIFFKFAAPVLLIGATVYNLAVKTSSATQVSLFRDSTTGNVSRYLRTTTTGAPAAGDDLIIAKEWTAAATGTARTVTMDSTAATAYGASAAAATAQVTPAIAISQGGTLAFGTAGSTNYILRVAGAVVVYAGGAFSEGVSGSAIPTTSTAVLEFVCAATGDYGLVRRNLSAAGSEGAPRTAGKLVTWCLLNADAANGSTTHTVDTDTGWLTGDEVVIASTIKPGANQNELKTLTGNATSTTIAVGATSFTHLGGSTSNSTATISLPDGTSKTAKMQAEVINLTRNVMIRSTSTTAGAYIYCAPTSTGDFTWTSFQNMSGSAVGKRGLEIDCNTSGSCNIQYCAFRDANVSNGYQIAIAPTTTAGYAIQVKNNVFWQMGLTTLANFMSKTVAVITPKTGGGAGYVIDSNVHIFNYGNSMYQLSDITGTFTNNRMVGFSTIGLSLEQQAQISNGTMSGNVIHSVQGAGNPDISIAAFAAWSEITLSNWTCWKAGQFATMYITASIPKLTLDGWAVWGNTFGIIPTAGSKIVMSNSYFSGASGDASTSAIFFDGGYCGVLLENCAFSQTNNFLTQIQNDITLGTGGTYYLDAELIARMVSSNGILATVGNSTLLRDDYGFISFQRLNGTAGNHKTYHGGGIIVPDTVIFKAASPSQKITPSSASRKCPTATLTRGLKVPVASGATKTVSVWTRKSAVGDAGGANYNGSQQRLILRKNTAMGISADTVAATATTAVGVWEQLTYVTPAAPDDGAYEFIVDCDGTAGWINVADWAVAEPTAQNKCWFDGLPIDAVFALGGSGHIIGG